MRQKALAARKEKSECSATLTRRTFLLGASGGLVAALTVPPARAEERAATPAAHGQYQHLAEAALNCVGWGERCHKHLMGLFASGDTSLVQCAARIQDMVAVCRAVANLAAAESEYLKPLAKVCIDVCKSCETECRKHEQRHLICKETADVCARLVVACEKIVA
ncbi:MAG: Csp1 family four helix bundle copper storage protein [Candidatus Binatia bacterium]